MRLETDPRKLFAEYRRPHFYAGHRPYQRGAASCWEGAKRVARINREWNNAERAGLVRIALEYDSDPMAWEYYFDGDTFNPDAHPGHPGGARAIIAERKRAERDAESYGFACLAAEYRTDPAGEWHAGDNVGGFLGSESLESTGHAPDVMAETLGILRDALRTESKRRADERAGRCPHCRGTGRA